MPTTTITATTTIRVIFKPFPFLHGPLLVSVSGSAKSTRSLSDGESRRMTQKRIAKLSIKVSILQHAFLCCREPLFLSYIIVIPGSVGQEKPAQEKGPRAD